MSGIENGSGEGSGSVNGDGSGDGGPRALGDFLRTRRLRLDPAALGLPPTRRRRTPGLRREEVAARAGISGEWYVKLEQGRAAQASGETLAALARALALDATETAHLRRLAARTRLPAFVRETVPGIVTAIVDALPHPAYVTGARWDVLAWNAAADALFGFAGMAEAERNILLYMFASPAARTLFGDDWAPQARRMVALFRPAHDQRALDPAFAGLVARLGEASAEFRRWWSAHDVAQPRAGAKTLPAAGAARTAWVYASFQSNDDPALKLALYAPRP